MGVSRTDLFDLGQNEIAQIARVFSHPARIAILQHMVEYKKCINSDLVDILGLAQPTVSQHLRELKLAGIIKGEIVGNTVSYCIDSKRWEEISGIFDQFFQSIPTDEDLR